VAVPGGAGGQQFVQGHSVILGRRSIAVVQGVVHCHELGVPLNDYPTDCTAMLIYLQLNDRRQSAQACFEAPWHFI
jgi:hypothetical protein